MVFNLNNYPACLSAGNLLYRFTIAFRVTLLTTAKIRAESAVALSLPYGVMPREYTPSFYIR